MPGDWSCCGLSCVSDKHSDLARFLGMEHVHRDEWTTEEHLVDSSRGTAKWVIRYALSYPILDMLDLIIVVFMFIIIIVIVIIILTMIVLC